jgi:NAD(P)-dependent dehydrogenase (short-subunit alcohol dehydrogenase family)
MGDATTIDLAAWDRDFRINVTSMVMMARYAIPEMRKNGRGAIVNMSSVSGRKLLTLEAHWNLPMLTHCPVPF